MRHRLGISAAGLGILATLSVSLLAPVSAGVFERTDHLAAADGANPSWVSSATTRSQRLAPGVELLSLRWGSKGLDDRWSVLVNLPTDPAGAFASGSMALGPKATAERAAAALRDAGYKPHVARVNTPAFADASAGTLGWTVKVGSYATAAEASAALRELRAAGFAGVTRYSAQDGSDTEAPQAAYVLRVDFDKYDGKLVAEHGATLNGRETLTDLIASTGAIAGIDAHWAYADGTAGLYVKDGRVIGGAITQGRGGVLVREGGGEVDVDSYTGHFWLTAGRKTIEVDGVNRPPGLIQNCGGVGGDVPTQAAQHDRLCTDDSELVRFTPEWGTVPTGTGAEAVLGARGRVLAVNPQRGAAVPSGGSTIQAIGESAAWLVDHVKVGTVVHWREEVRDSAGRQVRLTPDTTIMQVGPTLIDDGRIEINARADGLFHKGVDQSFTYNWVLRSNPRSSIATDAKGRLLLTVVDGRQATYSEGLGILDQARLLKRLGAVEALNLDGGGTSVLATSEGIVNRPSDATGQRLQENVWLLTP